MQWKEHLGKRQAVPDVGQGDLHLMHGAVVLVKLLAGVALKTLLVQHSLFFLLIVILQQMQISVRHSTIVQFHHAAQLYDLFIVRCKSLVRFTFRHASTDDLADSEDCHRTLQVHASKSDSRIPYENESDGLLKALSGLSARQSAQLKLGCNSRTALPMWTAGSCTVCGPHRMFSQAALLLDSLLLLAPLCDALPHSLVDDKKQQHRQQQRLQPIRH